MTNSAEERSCCQFFFAESAHFTAHLLIRHAIFVCLFLFLAVLAVAVVQRQFLPVGSLLIIYPLVRACQTKLKQHVYEVVNRTA